MSDKAKFISNITKNGMAVLSKVTQGNGKKLKFTKMAVGDGQIVDADGKVLPSFDPIQMTELHHKMMDMPIIRYQDKGNGTTSVTGRIDNKDLKKGFFIWEYGLYAEDPDTLQEILYCYSYALFADFFPAFEVIDFGHQLVENEYALITAIGRATDIEFVIDKSAVYVSVNEFEKQISSVTNIIQEHTKDTTTHVTNTDKTNWNSKANATDLNNHANNTTIHVTSADKTNWSNKANATDLSNHANNTTIHVTNADKTSWNAKVDTNALNTAINGISTSLSNHNHDGKYYKKDEDINIPANKLVKYNGTVIIDTNGRVSRAVYNDYAELFLKEDLKENIEAGDIVSWNKKGVIKTNKYQDRCIIGVFSDTYGIVLGGEESIPPSESILTGKYVPVGIAGRVYVKVIGDIEIGDLITSSNIAGIGCKCENYLPSTIIGTALESHSGNDIGRILIFIKNI